MDHIGFPILRNFIAGIIMNCFTRIVVLIAVAAPLLFAWNAPASVCAEESRPPNIVVIFADDLGYGDLGCYGHPTIRTPELDRMAAEGMRFTQFYSAANVCTPSRAALLTGRLPIRNGMSAEPKRVLFPMSKGGIQDSEITLAEALKDRGYATACVGKWHLGHLPQYLPTRHGFDSYFGIPYSNDMKPTVLIRGEEVIEDPADQTTLTARYTDEATKFIKENAQKPFFLYFPHTFPHTPLFASDKFLGTSTRGLYGDVVEELDASVGAVLQTLRDEKIAENTFVFFTSDNGPWMVQNQAGGSAGLLRDGKGTTWEGGMREPGIAWWPGKIPAGKVTQELGTTMDLFNTSILLAGGEPPKDRTLDGLDLRGVLLREEKSPRDVVHYYHGSGLVAIRKGAWKLAWSTQNTFFGKPEPRDPPLLFHLEHDPSERFNVAEKHSEVVAELKALAEEHQRGVEPVPTQLALPPPAKKAEENK